MKKILCVLLAVLVLFPSFALAAKPKGITIDNFQAYVAQSAKKYFDYQNVPMVDATWAAKEEGGRKSVEASAASATIYVTTFPSSEIVECAFIYLPIGSTDSTASKYSLAFLFAVVNNKNATKREVNADKILDGFAASPSLDENGNAYCSVKNEMYNTYMFAYGQGTVYMQGHQQSEMSYMELRKQAEETVIAVNAYVQPTASAIETTLSSGQWTCPEHIAAGEYKVLPVKSALVTVTRDESLVISEYLNIDEDDEIGRLVLEAGDTIQITGGKLSFEPFK